MLPTLKH